MNPAQAFLSSRSLLWEPREGYEWNLVTWNGNTWYSPDICPGPMMGLFPLCNGFAAGPKFTTYYGGIQLRQGMRDWSLDIMLIDAQILPQSNSTCLCLKIVSGILCSVAWSCFRTPWYNSFIEAFQKGSWVVLSSRAIVNTIDSAGSVAQMVVVLAKQPELLKHTLLFIGSLHKSNLLHYP